MNIVEISTGNLYDIEILPVDGNDYKFLTKGRYFFNWKLEKEQEVYKLLIQGSNEILGVVSLERIPNEWRIHIRLITVSGENRGKKKRYDKIIGNLIAYVSKLAVEEFGELACVSLKPKTQIAQHYIEKYNMNTTGITLSLEVPEILDLINQYDN
ncbi:hypothetical protein [Sphingobacterium hungaricum]|uniref:N-acetyltransferase n=1 Tax=Sphingobacterium hungaricum TaxID=2082723 RepID=A0A928YQN5_9SPHI|nr:hypothetical protein [Sphingobacterium hungaricum]MBE8713235.1 N-acetyltransferase [Sphingobacterium hungaricum]